MNVIDKVYYYIPTDQIFVITSNMLGVEPVYAIHSEDGHYPACSDQIRAALYYKELFYVGEL